MQNTLEWGDQDGNLVVQKAARLTLEDARKAPRLPAGVHKTDEEIRSQEQGHFRSLPDP